MLICSYEAPRTRSFEDRIEAAYYRPLVADSATRRLQRVEGAGGGAQAEFFDVITTTDLLRTDRLHRRLLVELRGDLEVEGMRIIESTRHGRSAKDYRRPWYRRLRPDGLGPR